LSKKEKLINKEIGNLIGVPLCWTQEGSEIDQFRKTMMWLRLQARQSLVIKTRERQESDTKVSFLKRAMSTPDASAKILVQLRLPLLESSDGSSYLEKTVSVSG
jgi:hypothetical protein